MRYAEDCRRGRGLGRGEDHRHCGFDSGVPQAGSHRAAVQMRPGLYRPELSRTGRPAALPQSGYLDAGRQSAAGRIRSRVPRRRYCGDRGSDGVVRRRRLARRARLDRTDRKAPSVTGAAGRRYRGICAECGDPRSGMPAVRFQGRLASRCAQLCRLRRPCAGLRRSDHASVRFACSGLAAARLAGAYSGATPRSDSGRRAG